MPSFEFVFLSFLCYTVYNTAFECDCFLVLTIPQWLFLAVQPIASLPPNCQNTCSGIWILGWVLCLLSLFIVFVAITGTIMYLINPGILEYSIESSQITNSSINSNLILNSQFVVMTRFNKMLKIRLNFAEDTIHANTKANAQTTKSEMSFKHKLSTTKVEESVGRRNRHWTLLLLSRWALRIPTRCLSYK